MKTIKKLIFIIIIVLVINAFHCNISFAQAPSLTPEQQAYIARYTRTYVTEGAKRDIFAYDDNCGNYEKAYNNIASSGVNTKTGESYRNKLVFVCSSFCATMLHQAVDAPLAGENGYGNTQIRGTGFANPSGRGSSIFNKVSDGEILQPGDVITGSGYSWHAMLYIGMDPQTGKHQIAETGGSKSLMIRTIDNLPANTPVTVSALRAAGGRVSFEGDLLYRYGNVSRLKPEVLPANWKPTMPIVIQWPDGTTTVDDGQLIITEYVEDGSELWYNGIANLVYEGEAKTWIETVVNFLGEILDYLIGLITMAVRMPLIGLANIAESILNWILQIFSEQGVLEVITIEDIIFNRVPLLDINIFSEINTAESGFNVVSTLRNIIFTWYYIFRTIAIIGMLITLIYMGIRIATTAIAEQKAKYKKMLIDWLISFIIIFVIHCYIVIVISANNFLLGIFERQAIQTGKSTSITENIDSAVIENENADKNETILSTQSGLFNRIRTMAYSVKLVEGWLGTFAYIILIWYTIKFSIKYLKRLFNIFILILLAPFIAINYAIDKIKDGKSQSLSKWMKELGFGVLLQSIHALVYTIFVTIVIMQIDSANIFNLGFSCILLFVSFNFMDKAENLFEDIFNFKSNSISTATSTIESIATIKSIGGIAKGYKEAGKAAIGFIGNAANHPLKPYFNRAKYGDAIPDKKNGNSLNYDSQIDYKIEEEKRKAKAIEAEISKQRKEAVASTVKAIRDIAMFIPTMAENPMTGITLLVSGITGSQRAYRSIKSFRTYSKMNSKVEMYEKVKLLNQRKNLEIQLRNEIDAMMQEESTIIGKGFASNATQAEYKQAQTAHKMLIEQMKLQLQRVDKSIVEQAVNESLLENNGEINETVLEKIATKIEQKSKAKGKDIQIDREALGKNIDGVLAGNLTQQALNKTKGKKSNDNLAQEIKKAKEKLKKDLAKQAQTTKMSKNEKRENLERGIKQELEAYIKEQQNKNEILKELKVNDLANLITEAMNTEGSFLRQLDGDGTKSTSNEDTKIGGQSDLPEQDGLGVHSNVDMKKTKESTKSEGGSKTSSTVELKNVDVNKVYEEISPILETVAEIRKVEEKLNRESVKVKKAKVEDIVNKIGENISRNNSGSVERARQKARERSNAGASKEQLPGRKSKRSTSNVKDKDKEKIGKNNAPQIKLKN